jgi:MFS family permease
VNIALPSIQVRFQMNAVLLSWIQTSFLLAAAVSMVPLGRLSDIYGRKAVFGWGLAVFAVSTGLGGLSVSWPMLMIARICQGASASATFATAWPLFVRFSVGGTGRASVFTDGSFIQGFPSPRSGGRVTQHLGCERILTRCVLVATCPILLHQNQERVAEARANVSTCPAFSLWRGLIALIWACPVAALSSCG